MNNFTKEQLLKLQEEVITIPDGSILPEEFVELKNTVRTTSNHYDFLYLIAEWYEPKIVVEIGTHDGVSACAMKYAYPFVKLYTIDINPDSGKVLYPTIIRIIGNSGAVADQVPDEIDILYIDGDHSFKAAKRDFETYLPKMRKGGLILIDDVTSVPERGVRMFWNKLKKGKIKLSRPIQEIITFDKIHGEWGFGGVIV